MIRAGKVSDGPVGKGTVFRSAATERHGKSGLRTLPARDAAYL